MVRKIDKIRWACIRLVSVRGPAASPRIYRYDRSEVLISELTEWSLGLALVLNDFSWVSGLISLQLE